MPASSQNDSGRDPGERLAATGETYDPRTLFSRLVHT